MQPGHGAKDQGIEAILARIVGVIAVHIEFIIVPAKSHAFKMMRT